jgi:hypothetical protein
MERHNSRANILEIVIPKYQNSRDHVCPYYGVVPSHTPETSNYPVGELKPILALVQKYSGLPVYHWDCFREWCVCVCVCVHVCVFVF